MTFSIVIPTYNGELFVRDAIESTLRQTRPADEIIVSDDCSTDKTVDIAREYEPRIRVEINDDGPSGFVNGWNKAINRAQGDYVSILHQDDIIAPTFLEEVEKAILDYPEVGHIFVPCNNINAEGDEIAKASECDGSVRLFNGEEYALLYMTHGSPHIHRCPGVVTKRKLFDKCRYRTEAGHIADDDFFMRIGNYTDVVGIMKSLASYRVHEKSETGHLSNLKLSKRLARDWHYQCRHAKDNKLMNKDLYRLLCKNRYEDSRRVIGIALRTKNYPDILYGLSHLLGLPKL